MIDSGQVNMPSESQLQELTEEKAILNANHKIGLFNLAFAPDADSTEADFLANLVDYHGYAPVPVVISGTPGIGDGGVPYLPVDSVTFQTDTGVGTTQVGGWFLYGVTTAPVVCRYYGKFNQPIPMNSPLRQFTLDLELRGNGLSTWEASN